MGLLSSVGSFTRYAVEGTLKSPVMDTIREGLARHTIIDIDNGPMEKAVGWTSLEKPYEPDFGDASFIFGNYFVFCLRIDKKAVPAKIVNKLYHREMAKKMAQDNRTHLTRSEKKTIKDHVKNSLNMKMPAAPSIYDLLWDYEKRSLILFTTLKSANEELEELFRKSFHINLLRIFPYTLAETAPGLSDTQRDRLSQLSPSGLME